mmetsp:Transcript_6711/g.19857  ORF Transcript_6711/g.19857 Transcript_6711/m.19857 type:complete len:244 (-) Transcript_6711:1220-1951(-)
MYAGLAGPARCENVLPSDHGQPRADVVRPCRAIRVGLALNIDEARCRLVVQIHGDDLARPLLGIKRGGPDADGLSASGRGSGAAPTASAASHAAAAAAPLARLEQPEGAVVREGREDAEGRPDAAPHAPLPRVGRSPHLAEGLDGCAAGKDWPRCSRRRGGRVSARSLIDAAAASRDEPPHGCPDVLHVADGVVVSDEALPEELRRGVALASPLTRRRRCRCGYSRRHGPAAPPQQVSPELGA